VVRAATKELLPDAPTVADVAGLLTTDAEAVRFSNALK
jgi:hypothetical protein